MPERRDSLVFIPAWNEEESLPGVLAELAAELPGADVLVVDDGSTDATAQIGRSHGAHVLSFDENRGLKAGIAAGWSWAHEQGYPLVGRVDADGQHPVPELRRLLEKVRAGECDVAVGSRFVSGDGYPAYRYRPSAPRRLGTALLRRAMGVRLGQPFADATSGMVAASERALPLLARPYTSGAPEVEALVRLTEAGLRVAEVPVNMRARAGGASKLAGRKAVVLVLTVIGTLLAVGEWRRRRPRS